MEARARGEPLPAESRSRRSRGPRRPRGPSPDQVRRRRLTALVVLGGIVFGLIAVVVAAGSGGGAPKVAAKPKGPPPGPVSVLWMGDTTPGSSAGDPPDQARALFANVRTRMHDADFTFVNLEGTLARDVAGTTDKCGGDSGGTCFSFAAPASYAASLKWAGIDIVNVANNHANDFGPVGEAATLKALDTVGIAHTGQPNQITILRHGTTKVAFLGFAPYPWAARLDQIPQAQILIRRATTLADVVVVAIHAGAEGADQTHTPVGEEEAYGEDRGNTRGFAHAAVDAGADLVVGSGPHVLRGIERYRGKLIAYSLGNFAGWKNFAEGGVLSLSGMLEVRMTGHGVPTAAKFTPLVLADPGVPEYDADGQSTELVNSVSADDFTTNAAHIGSGGAIALNGTR
jgi:hypothetical protein